MDVSCQIHAPTALPPVAVSRGYQHVLENGARYFAVYKHYLAWDKYFALTVLLQSGRACVFTVSVLP